MVLFNDLSQGPLGGTDAIDPVNKRGGAGRHPCFGFVDLWLVVRQIKNLDKDAPLGCALGQIRWAGNVPQTHLQRLREIGRDQLRRVGMLASDGRGLYANTIKPILGHTL